MLKSILHWQSTVPALLILLGLWWFQKGKIDFTELTTYVALVPTILLLIYKKKNDSDKQIS